MRFSYYVKIRDCGVSVFNHLNSTSLTTFANENVVPELRYKPWGETRYPSGTTPTTYQFTGQRNEVSLGLYFYNARWYDSSTGRFAQADSIVPGGVQGLDRYAYVNNSPINYTDPSGHCSLSGHEMPDTDAACQWSNNNQSQTPGLTPGSIDQSQLTNWSKVTGIGGFQMYKLYNELWQKQDGWWWDVYGKDGNFSVWDFLSLTAYFEAGGHTEYASTLAEAGVRWYYGGGCYGNNNKCGSAENILNWWGAYSQSAAGRYNGYFGEGKSLDILFPIIQDKKGNNIDPSPMVIFGNSFQNPPAGWKGYQAKSPYGWANAGFGIWTQYALNMFDKNQKALFVDFGGFIIPSGCAWNSWQSHQWSTSCPSVP